MFFIEFFGLFVGDICAVIHGIFRKCCVFVDVGVVYSNEKNASGSYSKVAREIDFIASKGGSKVYIQSAFALPDEEKTMQELRPFSLTGDSFPKIIVRKDIRKRWYDDNGVLNVGLMEFLLDEAIV